MLDFAGATTVYLACGATDLRKSYNSLAALIKLKFHLDPNYIRMFAFCNRRRTSIKILQWDGTGFWILMKRLGRDSFHWPDTPDELKKVTLKEINWLCDGLISSVFLMQLLSKYEQNYGMLFIVYESWDTQVWNRFLRGNSLTAWIRKT